MLRHTLSLRAVLSNRLPFVAFRVQNLGRNCKNSFRVYVCWKKRIDCIYDKGLSVVINFFCISSFLNVVAISVDRFLAVRLHLRYQERVTHKRVIAAVISIWLLSVIISSNVFWDPLFIILLVIGLMIITVCLILVVIVY